MTCKPDKYVSANSRTLDLLTPVTASLVSEFEQMTLDTSPKESQLGNFGLDCINEEPYEQMDENKLRFQA